MLNRSFLRISLFAIIGLCCIAQAKAFAHFLFIRIGEQAEAGRGVEVFFSERAAAGDPRFIDKIANTQLWMQTEPGQFVPVKTRKGADRLRAYLPANGTVSVSGIAEYGVLQREVPFLLRYYPKAISGRIADINQLKANDKLTAEIVATVKAESISLTLLDHGKPVPHAAFTTVDDDLNNVELKTDEAGQVEWTPPTQGYYCIYAKVVRQQAGESGGKKYTEIREFPTLAFPWPLERTGPDDEAVKLFEQAIASRAQWHNFPGFSAQIEGDYDGRPFSGTVQVDQTGKVELKIDQEVAAEWVEDQLRSIVVHRLESSHADKPVLRFADRDEQNPLGRMLTFVGGRFASSYRVKDGQISVVNRNIGPENMTISVLENEKTAEGKYLPHLYNVQYWDAASGDLKRTESFENRWQRTGSIDLPALNRVVTSAASGLTVRMFKLSKQELLKANGLRPRE